MKTFKKPYKLIIGIISIILIIVGAFIVKSYFQEKAYDSAYNEVRDTLIQSGIIAYGENNYFDKLSISNVYYENSRNEISATVKNNLNVSLNGSVIAIFFNGKDIKGYALLTVNGLSPNEFVSINDVCRTVGGDSIDKYDKIKFYDGGIRKYK